LSLLLLDYGDDIRRAEDPIWTVVSSQEDGLKSNDPSAIFLIDHSWTFTTSVAKQQLLQIPGLMERLCVMMGIDKDEGTREECVDKILTEKLWKYCNTYSINAEGIVCRFYQHNTNYGFSHSQDYRLKIDCLVGMSWMNWEQGFCIVTSRMFV
jgi:hypothetical protein